jgi:hypothetical protein
MGSQHERGGNLREYLTRTSVNFDVYEVEHGWNTEKEEKTDPWLTWAPEEEFPDDERAPEEVKFVKDLKRGGFFQGWTPFESFSGYEESFVLSRHYGSDLVDEEANLTATELEIRETVEELCSRLSLEIPDPDPVAVLPTLKILRDESRSKLEEHTGELRNEVMKPLRSVLIPCAVEAARNLTGFRPLNEVDETERQQWLQTIRDLSALWDKGVGRGIPFEIIHEHENWYGRTFQHVPNPVARGAKIALQICVERKPEKHRDTSRDGILERARPVYFKWEATRRMIWSTLYDWTLEEALEVTSTREPEEIEGIRKRKPQQVRDAKTVYKASQTVNEFTSYSDLETEIELTVEDSRTGEALTMNARRFVESAFGTWPDDVHECIERLDEAAHRGWLNPPPDVSRHNSDSLTRGNFER